MDWDTWFFEVWENGENAGTEPTHEDYTDYLMAQAEDIRDMLKEQSYE